MDPAIYGASTNAFVLQHNSVIEVIVSNHHMIRHPFHSHGHNFQVLHRSLPKAGSFLSSGLVEDDFPKSPMRRDTLLLENGGFFVLRFRADNPGVWLFHCHMEWHVETGLVATMIEAPLELQRQHQDSLLPADYMSACRPAQDHEQGLDESVSDEGQEKTSATNDTKKTARR